MTIRELITSLIFQVTRPQTKRVTPLGDEVLEHQDAIGNASCTRWIISYFFGDQ